MAEPKQINLTISGSAISSEMSDLFLRKRPVGWSRKSNAPYYNVRYATWLKKDVDAMIIDKRPRIYRYETFKSVSSSSLYARINQALLYLCEKMDDANDTYKNFKHSVRVERERGVGVTIMFHGIEDTNAGADVFVPDCDKPKWMLKMDAWLESSESNLPPFHQQQLALSPEAIAELELMLSEIAGILYTVTPSEIKIIKATS